MGKSVAPPEIESALEALWEAIPGKQKVKAALFTLIAYVEEPSLLGHTQSLLKHILGRYPCRVLLLLEERSLSTIETSVSLELVGGEGSHVSCDQIEIRFPPEKRQEIPFLLLPHLLSNVPVSLLWKGIPDPKNPIYPLLEGEIGRLIVDPETAEQTRHIADFAQPHLELIDLKWTAISGWRRVVGKVFGDPACIAAVHSPASFTIKVAKAEGLSSRYLEAWLASQLGWTIPAHVEPVSDSPYTPGTLLALNLTTEGNYQFSLTLEPSGEVVRVEASSPEWCEIPCSHYIGSTHREALFAKELFSEQVGPHYQAMLRHLWQSPPLPR
ncbi:MAG: glucose-6-phosphate dehydrogenase assembly protein OpcA [Parachlamydiales bacterium]